ncbi:MAG: hypothetical protein U9N01_00050 [Euryarchaeota archaeon]|nr:hypothetical protein [Euryarchaeota archaeon]
MHPKNLNSNKSILNFTMLSPKSENYLKHFTFIPEDESAEERYICTQTNRVIKIKVVDSGIKISGDTESLGKTTYWILTGKTGLPSNLKRELLI